jgi:hypothetical protein
MAKAEKGKDKTKAKGKGSADEPSKRVVSGAKRARKDRKRRRADERNGYAAAARFCVSVAVLCGILLTGVTAGRVEERLAPAVVAFFLVWFALGLAERAISASIARVAHERYLEEVAARQAEEALVSAATADALAQAQSRVEAATEEE